MESGNGVRAWVSKIDCPKCGCKAWEFHNDHSPTFDIWLACPVCLLTGAPDDSLVGAVDYFIRAATAAFPQSKKARPYSVLDERTAERAPIHDTYDLRTGPDRAQAQLDDLAARVRRLEAQLSGEIRQIAERLQQVEHILDQYAGDHR